MDINIKRFVNIDIHQKIVSSVSSIRDTAVLLTSDGNSNSNKVFSSYAAMLADNTYKGYAKTLKYAKVFFDNGGVKLDVHCGIASKDAIVTEIKNLPTSEIIVGYAGDASMMKEAATEITALSGTVDDITKVYGINQKILLSRVTAATDNSSINNFAVKVSATEGAEMTIAAYLTKLSIYGTDTIHDYAFTSENITAEPNNDEVLGAVLDNNMNVDMTLVNAVRNLGGNLTNGLDIVNQYVLIVLQQTVTDRLLNLLTQKIKGQSGISAIYTAIAGELGRYVTNGYLVTDKVWTDETKTTSYNGKTYTLIEKNTPLTLGYRVVVLPYSSLSEDDKQNHKCPPIYIFLAESYGIRSITINGEVI